MLKRGSEFGLNTVVAMLIVIIVVILLLLVSGNLSKLGKNITNALSNIGDFSFVRDMFGSFNEFNFGAVLLFNSFYPHNIDIFINMWG